MTLSTKKEKQRNQVKSRFYYLFWGAATLSVFVGQIYVGSGYRRMATSFDRIVNTVIIEFEAVVGNNTGDCLPNMSAKTTPT